MNVRPIRSEADHDEALREIERLWGAKPGTSKGDKLDVLATLVEAYEAERYPVPEADPVDVLNFAIQDMGRSQADLARILGSRSRASEILNRRRPLTLEMIRAISSEWKLPISSLTGAYELRREYA